VANTQERGSKTLASDLSDWPKAPGRADSNVDRAAQLIRRKIFTQDLPPGTMLPPERVLSARLDVSRNSLRSALAKLESEGLLDVRQGRGVTVLDYRESGGLSLVRKMPRAMQDELVPEILEMRTTLALSAAAKATLRATDEQVDELAALALLLQDTHGLEALVSLDLRFSRMLVRAARSVSLELLLNAVSRLLEGRPDICEVIFYDRDDVRSSYVMIVEALRSRAAGGVGELMRLGLEHRDRKTLERFGIAIEPAHQLAGNQDR